MKKEQNIYLRLGLLGFAVYLVLNEFCPDLEFLKGFLFGLSLSIELYGIILQRHPDTPIRRWKKKLFHRI